MANSLINFLGSTDVIYGGHYQIRGIVTKDGAPCSRKVMLYNRLTGAIVRSNFSNSDGSYAFSYIGYSNQGYFVLALDNIEPLENAAIADLITPEPMP